MVLFIYGVLFILCCCCSCFGPLRRTVMTYDSNLIVLFTLCNLSMANNNILIYLSKLCCCCLRTITATHGQHMKNNPKITPYFTCAPEEHEHTTSTVSTDKLTVCYSVSVNCDKLEDVRRSL